MIKHIVTTLLWVGAIYLLIRPSLKKANRLTRWTGILLLGASGALWVILTMTIKVPRPAHWLEQMFSMFVPVP